MPTTLVAGDLAIIGSNADNPDAFSFVLLADIDAGTEIFFTDNGVFSDGSFRTTEGIVQYTAPSAIAAGTVVQFTGINGDFTEEDAGFALTVDGDQVIAYQGSVAAPTFIYAAQTNSTQFQATSTSSRTSALPPGLTVGTTAVAVGAGSGAEDEFDNSTYNETLTSGTQAELLAAIGNAANWTGSNTSIPLADGPFTVIPPDTTAPTVTLTSAAADPINSSFSVTATFSEATSDFTDTDITATNGSVSNFSGSGTTYTFDVTPIADGVVTVDIASSVATDAAGNGNTAADTLSRTFDATAPTVTLTSTAPEPITSTFSVTTTFSEATSDFIDSDIAVTNGSVSNFNGSGTTYTFDVTPTATGVVAVDIANNVATDLAGNGNTAATTLSRTFETASDGNEGRLTPMPANNLLEVTALGSANTVTLDIGQFGLDSVSQIRIFSTGASGMPRTEIGSISLLEREQLPDAYSPEFTVNSDTITQGGFLQFELVENGQIRVPTLTSISESQVALDFGEEGQLTVSLAEQSSTTNVLIDDAAAIDLTGFDGGALDVEFTVYREAAFDNTLGIYETDFADGSIITDPLTGAVVRPGEAGYEQAAINQQLDIEITGQNNQVNTFSATVDGGGFLGMFLIVDGTDPATNEVYFSHARGNSDGTDRARLLGNNTFGFEDLPNLGDRDFDDVVVEFSIA
ncbi:MAG: Ig-like domain-containing protein [Cyanobacteria bacterium P01_A01_bin.3]